MPQEQKLVELGRVVHITTGPKAVDKIGAIVDIIDAKRMLVDGPSMLRQEIKLKDMFLTRILLKCVDVPSHKALIEMWKKNLVDERYKMTVHAQRREKFRRRAACTDFEFFKVRNAARTVNKIKEACLVDLHAKHPRALAKMDRKRRIDMGVRLGYRTLKVLTPEEKAVKAAREKIIKANRKVLSAQYFKDKKEKRAKVAEVRRARIARKKEAGTLKLRPTVAKADRKPRRKNKTPNVPRISTAKAFRCERDAIRKEASVFRKTHTKALQENRAAIKAAVAAGTKPPHKLHAKTIKPKRSTVRTTLKKRQEAKKAAAVAAAE